VENTQKRENLNFQNVWI